MQLNKVEKQTLEYIIERSGLEVLFLSFFLVLKVKTDKLHQNIQLGLKLQD